ncbi:gp276 [Klebsiella phage vB_KoM-Pickle]|nr:hypothetical protein 4DII_00264 [Klebsiella phage PSKm4DII]WPJ20979.1 hypothetical protein OOGAAMIP_00222 [Klebsiella phage Kp11_Ajakkala-2023]CAA7537959.1 Hypothetical protein ONPBNFGJ_00238 [Klebsiella phage vB_KpnM_05F]CAD5242780.1 gp276 [Klebsiella phage vB_KoM-Pickle]CAD6025366.1 gp276 [Klebsiella phage vB_KoM-MeTiny]
MNLNHECLKDLSDGNEIGNVIFLDIDGVLNNMRCMKFGEHMDIECARHLRRIVNHANCDIVISSTWRIGNSTHNLREIFYPWGLYRIIGKTCTNFPHSTGMRGDEIKAWIDTFGCKNYLILDDDTDMLSSQKEHFIKTDGFVGLTEEQSTYAIRNVFGVTTPFCPECNGYGRVNDYDKCGTCNGKILRL